MSFRIILNIGVLLLTMLSFNSNAATEETSKPAVNPARSCVMCHKKEPAKMLGPHAQAINPHDNTAVNCTNCHQPVDPNEAVHPKNRSNITMYRPLFPSILEQQNKTSDEPSDDSEPAELTDAVTQNGLCMNCHTPETLRQSFWPHDVHATELSCSDCHKVHPEADPMKGKGNADEKMVPLCLDCHNQMKSNREVKP